MDRGRISWSWSHKRLESCYPFLLTEFKSCSWSCISLNRDWSHDPWQMFMLTTVPATQWIMKFLWLAFLNQKTMSWHILNTFGLHCYPISIAFTQWTIVIFYFDIIYNNNCLYDLSGFNGNLYCHSLSLFRKIL